MNPLIKKEIRLLLPTWIVALSLPLILVWLTPILGTVSGMNPDNNGQVMFLISLLFTLGFSMLGIASFGHEFNSGTFSAMLSQPAERRRLWWMKTITLGIGFLLILFAWAVSAYLVNLWTVASIPLLPFFAYLLLFSMAAFSGGLWSTLLLRQTTGAFWFTLLAPLAIIVGIEAVLSNWAISDRSIVTIIAVAFLLYSLAGFFFAQWLFFRAQDIQWTGGEISFPWSGKMSRSATASVSARPRHWLSALIWKEIHLQQANILIAAIILVLHLFSLFIRKIHPHFENPDVQFIFESHWLLWLLMPLLIGATAIAEERRMGTLESQLCLSVSRRTQLFIKFTVALVLSLLLGGAMPLLLEGTKELNPFYALFIVVAMIFCASFYSSSAVRTTLQAIGMAILLGLVTSLYEVVTAYNFLILHYSSSTQLGLDLLKLYFGPPILLLALGGLTLWNFERLHEYRKPWRCNLVVLVVAFASIFILTNGIYFRGWELFMPSESRGPARLESSSRVTFAQNYSMLYSTLPDGRLWIETLGYQDISNRWGQSMVVVPRRSWTQFLAGSNWVRVAADNFQALGIQSDGTLWSLQRKWNPFRARWNQTGAFTIAKIGSDTDWSQAAGSSMGFLLLKKNGSLWIWGTHGYDWRTARNPILQKLKLDLAATPARIGVETNWTELSSSREPSAYAKKNDGSWWTWQERTNHILTMILETNLNNQWSDWTLDYSSFLGVKTNGELWYYETVYYSSGGKHSPVQRHIPLGMDRKWKTATMCGDDIFAMRDDGTLWRWSPRWALGNNQSSIKAVQLGNHSDWITLASTWHIGFTLAPDGNLYAWDQPSHHVWLAPSRRPVYIGNIFEGEGENP